MAAFIANIGVNAGHAAHSPLFADGSFAVLPVPEPQPWGPPMTKLSDHPHLFRHAPKSWSARVVHLDPDLTSEVPTYGDNCRTAGRAFSLRHAQSGDILIFLARLQPRQSPAGFYLVGCLEIEDALTDVSSDPGPGWWDGNAHVRRARAGHAWNSFWVFKGGRRSGWFQHAVAFTKPEAAAVFGDVWRWRTERTDLQTIGSYTRAIRRVEGPGEKWLRTICQF